jgi:glycosyltransferase involved in cell wall biosynthesis
MNQKLTILHVITGTQIGGAEMMLCRLLEAMDHTAFECHVVCLGPRGPLAERVIQSGAKLTCLNLKGPLTFPRGLWQLSRIMRQLRPDAVHTWMYHADLLGGLAAKFGGGNPPVTWALHHSHAAGGMKRTTKLIVKLLARWSSWLPTRIVSCSTASTEEHAKLGYDISKIELIFNGADAQVFKPDAEARALLRETRGIPSDAPTVGFVGRCVPVKDLPTFFKAAALVQKQLPDAHFVFCGPNLDEAPHAVHEAMQALPYPGQLRFLSFRPDVAKVYPAFDLLALTSLSEACPMSLIEAMSCGVPCASTDVGDAAFIINRPEAIAPAGDASKIAATWLTALTMSVVERAELSSAARQRATDVFSLSTCVHRYQSLYRDLANIQTAPQPVTLRESNVMP